MAEKIFTIPINEAFDRYEGCPLCFLRDKLEEQTLGLMLGEAMMEPGFRSEINKAGFCRAHYSGLYAEKNKLALGLILESHLDEVRKSFKTEASGGRKGLFGGKKREGNDAADAMSRLSKSCLVCSRISYTENRYYSNIIYLWERDGAFRVKLKKQPYFCVSHFAGLLKYAKTSVGREDYAELYSVMTAINDSFFERLRAWVTGFCVSFDYRNASRPLTEDERASLERAIKALR
jgi:hypothetical protein